MSLPDRDKALLLAKSGAERARDRWKASCKSFEAGLASLVRATEIIAAGVADFSRTRGFGHRQFVCRHEMEPSMLAGAEFSLFGSNASMRNFVAQLRTVSLPYSAQSGQEPASPPRIAGSTLVMS